MNLEKHTDSVKAITHEQVQLRVERITDSLYDVWTRLEYVAYVSRNTKLQNLANLMSAAAEDCEVILDDLGRAA